MLKNQDLDQEDKTEELNHKEKKEKIAKINQEEITEVEEETPEVEEVVKEKCQENKEQELMTNIQFMSVWIFLNIFNF